MKGEKFYILSGPVHLVYYIETGFCIRAEDRFRWGYNEEEVSRIHRAISRKVCFSPNKFVKLFSSKTHFLNVLEHAKNLVGFNEDGPSIVGLSVVGCFENGVFCLHDVKSAFWDARTSERDNANFGVMDSKRKVSRLFKTIFIKRWNQKPPLLEIDQT